MSAPMGEQGAVRLHDLLRAGRARLAACGLEDPGLEARILIEHLTGTDRAVAIADPERLITPETVERVAEALARRERGEPVHRILGVRDFYGLSLALSPATLEPRPDTETLVEAMLAFVRDTAVRTGRCRILDLGTGTGAIALALLSAVPEAVATGTDLSGEALATARRNASDNGLEARFEALASDWFEAISDRYDAIVSNPPYIRTGAITGLDVEVRAHDPRLALDGGADGLDAYRRIAAGCRTFLAPGGRVGVEIGHDQKADVAAIFAAGGLRPVEARRDLGGRDRVLIFADADTI
jgi:release factor glutamine methyltransferase